MNGYEKMRDALEICAKQMSDAICDKDFGDDVVYLVGCMKTCVDFMKAALAASPRNCDVGTAEEQYGRYIKFCNRRRLMKSNCDMDCPCAAKNFNDHFCQLEWAQMPYEEGDAK